MPSELARRAKAARRAGLTPMRFGIQWKASGPSQRPFSPPPSMPSLSRPIPARNPSRPRTRALWLAIATILAAAAAQQALASHGAAERSMPAMRQDR